MADQNTGDFGDIGNIFFQDGYRLAGEYLGGPINRDTIFRLMSAAYEAMDGLIVSFVKRCEQENIPVDCHKGCAFCCSQAILASNHEILVIWQYITQHFDKPELDGIRIRAVDKNERTKGMNAREFLHFIHPCPFLKDSSCSIYPVRPMACRCYLSSNLQSCIEQYEKPQDRTRIAELFEFPLKAGRGMNEGIRSALMAKGLVPSEWLLETFVVGVFEDESRLEAWLGGEKPFNIRILTAEENQYLRDYYN